MTGVQPYPAYRDSGVEWLGKVPEHWEVRRLKHWLEINERALPEDTDPEYTFGYLDIGSVTTGRLATKPERLRFQNAPSRARRVVRHGDTIVSTVRTYLKAVWHATNPEDGLIASTGFAVLTPRDDAFPEFVSYTCQSDPFTERVTAESVGIAYPAIAETKLATFEVCVPPLAEQAAIARFLDHADRRIRRCIRAKERLVELLGEQKQAIIHQAVTGRINVRTGQPYPAYRDSGVEWLGKVPEHWEVWRLKFLIEGKLTYGTNAAAKYTNTEWPRYLRITDFAPNGRLRHDTFRSLPPEAAKDCLVEPGDVLLARSGTVGKAFLVEDNSGEACHAGYLIKARPNHTHLLPSFLFDFTQSAEFRRWKDLTLIITTIPNISADKYSNLPVPTPPLSEQTAIARFLDHADRRISERQSATVREIELLREYRTCLIADVVTGKLDAREAAARLPDGDDEKAGKQSPEELHE